MDTLEELNWEDYFPYSPRPLQEGIINSITKLVPSRTHLILEAANGVGKTITALAALLPYAKSNGLKIVYTARTHSQIDRVMQELENVSKITQVSGVALRGREAFCLNTLVKKHAKSSRAVQIMCKQLKLAKKCDFFNNMRNENSLKIVLNELSEVPATAEYIFDVCQAASICPAETVRKMLPVVDVIACSYLYLFDPDIRQVFLESINRDLEEIILVIDEAHNLPEMVNAITSDSLSSFSFNRAMREANINGRDDFYKFLDYCSNYLINENRNMKLYQEKSIDPAEFLEEVELKIDIELDDEFFEDMVELGDKLRFKLAKQGKEPRSSLGRIGEFFLKWYNSMGKYDFAYSVEKQKFSEGRDTFVRLNLNSLDSSEAILPVLSDVYTSISMTGTLGDADAYSLLTGLDQLDMVSNILPSPYSPKNIKTLITKEITTLYQKRSPQMWKAIADTIVEMAKYTPANVGVFAPSYDILNKILKYGLESNSPKEIIIAKMNMSSQENDKLVSKFKSKAKFDGAILCSVLGGRSSEGADFPGDLMNAVAVIGIPYAPPSVKSQAQIKFLETKFTGKGRSLAYEIPAINRASQAAGRPVRSLNDKAFILLLDYRYSIPNVRQNLPGWIKDSIEIIENDPKLIGHRTRQFFDERL